MKFIHPIVIAAALLAPVLVTAQTSRPDRSVDTDGTNTAEPSETERASTTGATRNEPHTSERGVLPGSRPDSSSAFDKNRDQLHADIAELKSEVETLRATTTDKGRAKLDAVTARIEELEARTMAAGEGTERDFNENKHKFKNELKKIRRELKNARKHRTGPSETAPAELGNP